VNFLKEEEKKKDAVFIRESITNEDPPNAHLKERRLSLLVNQSQMRIRPTRNMRNTNPNHGSMSS
jgi:hypothetical protein